MSPFSHLLHDLRTTRNIRQAQLAAMVGYDQTYISALEVGLKGNPTREFVNRIAEALALEPAEVAELSEAAEASQRKLVIGTDVPQEVYVLNNRLRTTLPLAPSQVRYDPQEDFAPLSVLMRAPSLILVPADSPHDSLRALMSAARAAPGKLNYAAGSPGYQLIAEQFNELAGLETNHVPFKGASEAVVAVASGVVDFGVAEVTSAQELVKAGRLRALAVAAEAPTGALPGVPTAAQAGLPGMVAYLRVGAMVPAATPAEETETLATLFSRSVEMPETRAFYARLGAETMTAGPEAIRRFQADDIALWQRIVVQAGVPQH